MHNLHLRTSLHLFLSGLCLIHYVLYWNWLKEVVIQDISVTCRDELRCVQLLVRTYLRDLKVVTVLGQSPGARTFSVPHSHSHVYKGNVYSMCS